MPKQIQKSLQECLSKMKISRKQLHFPIRSCRRPKTPSFGDDDDENQEHQNDAVTLSDIDKFLFENFKSLYQIDEKSEEEKSNKTTSFLFGSPPPAANLRRSARFFVSSGSSSSLISDEASPSSSSDDSPPPPAAEAAAGAPDDFIALLTYSPSPYEDFRRSMKEMVDARVEHNGGVDWAFLEELLFCYLDLNNKKSYGYILRAFVDLIVVLRETSGRVPARLSGGAWRRHLN